MFVLADEVPVLPEDGAREVEHHLDPFTVLSALVLQPAFPRLRAPRLRHHLNASHVLAQATADAAETLPDADDAVPVEFWHRQCNGSPRRASRDNAISQWSEIRRNYSAGPAAALDHLMAIDPATLSGRLVLLHGPPGTGKTTAVRSLAHAWRAWCRFEVVVDPEVLYGDAAYLTAVLLEEEESESTDTSRWRLLVIEDCDELVRADAKKEAGRRHTESLFKIEPNPLTCARPQMIAHLSMVLLGNAPSTPENDCASATVDNCGKVLANFGGRPGDWKLYDPKQGDVGAWSEIVPPSPHQSTNSAAVQLKGPGCGAACGKVFIVGQGGFDPAVAELYDPKTNLFETLGLYAQPGTNRYDNALLAELPDGRVLLTTTMEHPPPTQAWLLNPTDWKAEPIEPPVGRYHNYYPSVPLPQDGSVLFLGSMKDGFLDIYRPSAGLGSWVTPRIPDCRSATTPYCRFVSVLPDGKILAHRKGSGSAEMAILDPTNTTNPWKDAASLNRPAFRGMGVLLSGPACGKMCNKILFVGQEGYVEVYTPP